MPGARAHLYIRLLLLCGCIGLALAYRTPPAEARVIGRSAEISIGRETASVIESFFQVDTDPVAVARVRGIGRRLAAAARDPDFPFEFHVVESGEVNAFALPGGFIYVFKGLLQLVPNDDALAFVLAHEISHVTGRHAIKQFEKNLLLNGAITAILAGTGARGYGRAADLVSAIASARFTRTDESQADEHGIDLLHRAGYNTRAAMDAMRIVKRAGGPDSTPALLRTHPAPDSRIRRLEEWSDLLLKQRAEERMTGKLPPAPPWRVRRLPGLDALEVAPCAWQPLAPGMRWVYRLTDGQSRTEVTVRVLDELDADPEGVFRVEQAYGRELRSVRWLAPAGDRFAARAERATEVPWRIEAVFVEGARVALESGSLLCMGEEKITVPAGEYLARRVRRSAATGETLSEEWYVQGIGLVRRTSHTGAVMELVLPPARIGSSTSPQ